MHKYFYFFIFLFTVTGLTSQNTDSLKFYFGKSKSDSATAKLCVNISYNYLYENLDSAFMYAAKAQARLNGLTPLQQCSVYKLLGILNSNKGKNEEALKYFLYQLKVAEEYDLLSQSADANLCIAGVFEESNYEDALNYFRIAVEQAKKANDLKRIDIVLETGSTFYFNHLDYNNALFYWHERLKYRPELANDERYLAGLGDICRNNNQFSKAETYYLKAIGLAKNNNNTGELILLYNNFALIPYKQGNITLAIDYYKKAREISVATGNVYQENAVNGRLADMLFKNKQYKEASSYANDAINYYKNDKHTRELKDLYELRSNILFQLQDYKGAYESKIVADKYKEELLNVESQAKLSQLKESIITENKNYEIKMQSYIILSITALFIILLITTFIIIKQKRTITLEKLLREKEHAEVTKSIEYAEFVQNATFPSQEFLKESFKDYFIFYLPKDIVAGDFYWCKRVGLLRFIAAADSTGHGVPGAFVSLICSKALDTALNEFNILETGKILDKARELILKSFINDTVKINDGMDISLLCIDEENKKISWSGANNPLWYVSPEQKELIQLKADKQPVGKTEHSKPFTTHQINYKDGNIFYLFTDGFPDQFGGAKGKKFKYKPFSDVLLENAALPLEDQRRLLEKTFNDWKGDLDQVDDVCIIGIRV